MPSVSSISWTFPIGKIYAVIQAFLSIFEDPLAIILGLSIIFIVISTVTGIRTQARDPFIWSQPGENNSEPIMTPKTFGHVWGDNPNQRNLFNTNNRKKFWPAMGDSAKKVIRGVTWEGVKRLNPLQVFGFGHFDPNGPVGDIFYHDKRAKDFDDPVDWLEHQEVFNRHGYVDGEYLNPEIIYQRGLQSLDPTVRHEFLQVKDHLSEFYKGQLNDYQLLEIFATKINLPKDDEEKTNDVVRS